MPKRRRPASEDAHALPSNQNVPQRIILCGLYDEGKTAVAKCLLQELRSATVIACDLKAGRRAVPKKSGEFEVTVYTEAPQLPAQDLQNVVVLCHPLAQPSRVAAALASANCAVRLLTVLDARSFLDEWESTEELPVALREARPRVCPPRAARRRDPRHGGGGAIPARVSARGRARPLHI